MKEKNRPEVAKDVQKTAAEYKCRHPYSTNATNFIVDTFEEYLIHLDLKQREREREKERERERKESEG